MRGTLRRFALLLRHLGPRWVFQRLLFALQERLGWFLWRTPARDWSAVPLRGPRTRGEDAPRFFFDPEDFARWRRLLKEWDLAAGLSPTAEADGVLTGRIRYFGGAERDVGCPPAWHRDPETQTDWPRDSHWSRIEEFEHGDVKRVWEASRFAWVFPLVRAFARTGDERYAEGFWRFFESWLDANPPNLGVQWKCGQEAALRALAVIVGAQAFSKLPTTTDAHRARLQRFLRVSAERIEAHVSYGLSQKNNHGISEGVGLWTIGLLYPECARAGRWKNRGRWILERQVRELFYKDGAFSQHSTNYERLTLQCCVWAVRLGEINGQSLTSELKKRLASAVRFLQGLQDGETGELPVVGHDDGALFLPLSNGKRRDFRPALQAAAVILEQQRLFPHGPWDEESLWLAGAGTLAMGRQPEAGGDLAAPDGGYFTLRSPSSFALLRVPRFRHRPSHVDLLHVDLWWHGINVALDAGTYSYNASPPWDTPLARAAYHNTVTVGGRDPMERVGRFLWLPWSEARLRCRSSSADGSIGYLEAEQGVHDGSAAGVRHRRALVRLGDETWVVVDELASPVEQPYRLHWLLCDAPHEFLAGRAAVDLELAPGRFRVEARALDHAFSTDLVRAAVDSPRGWRAPTYDERAPALSLVSVSQGRSVRFVTLLAPAEVDLETTAESLRLGRAPLTSSLRLGTSDDRTLVTRIESDAGAAASWTP